MRISCPMSEITTMFPDCRIVKLPTASASRAADDYRSALHDTPETAFKKIFLEQETAEIFGTIKKQADFSSACRIGTSYPIDLFSRSSLPPDSLR